VAPGAVPGEEGGGWGAVGERADEAPRQSHAKNRKKRRMHGRKAHRTELETMDELMDELMSRYGRKGSGNADAGWDAAFLGIRRCTLGSGRPFHGSGSNSPSNGS
jgi:hypothetical protein